MVKHQQVWVAKIQPDNERWGFVTLSEAISDEAAEELNPTEYESRKQQSLLLAGGAVYIDEIP